MSEIIKIVDQRETQKQQQQQQQQQKQKRARGNRSYSERVGAK